MKKALLLVASFMAIQSINFTAAAENEEFDCKECTKSACSDLEGPYKQCKKHCKEDKRWKACLKGHKDAKEAAKEHHEKQNAVRADEAEQNAEADEEAAA